MGWLGGGTSLTVEEEDGSPSISGVSKIQVSNATLTDDGAGTVSMSMSPAGGANVALSNVDAQTAARVFAGPASGAAAAPTFRAIATTDLKSPDASGFLASNGAGVLSWATPAGTGANTALSNLASVAINTAPLPGTDNAIGLGSAEKRFTTGFASTAWSIYKAASDANPTARLGDAILSFGVGGASAVDCGIERYTPGYARITAGGTGTTGGLYLAHLYPISDNTAAIGSSALRVQSISLSSGASIYKAASEANPTATLGDGVLNFGAGTTNAVDVGLVRYKNSTNPAEIRITDGSTGNGNIRFGVEGTAGTVLRAGSTYSYSLEVMTGDYGNFGALYTGDVYATRNIIGNQDASVIKIGLATDVGFARSAAGVMKVTDGSTGYGGIMLDANARQWADTVTLTDAVKTAVVDIAIADAEFIGGTLTYTITATDATDHQALTGIVGFSGVRKNGTPDTYHLTIAESASPVLAESNGASTLADTWAIDAGTNVATISVTADSSLTTPTMTVRYQLTLNSANAATKK